MARYIDVDKFEDYVYDCAIRNVRVDCDRNCVECYYNNSGAEDVAPVIHSSWRVSYFEDGYKVNMTCLNCGETFSADCINSEFYNYCPNCNAKMIRLE